MIMKINLINIHSMKILNKKQTAGFSIYRFFTNLAFIIFIPLFIINIEYIFNLKQQEYLLKQIHIYPYLKLLTLG